MIVIVLLVLVLSQEYSFQSTLVGRYHTQTEHPFTVKGNEETGVECGGPASNLECIESARVGNEGRAGAQSNDSVGMIEKNIRLIWRKRS